MYYHCNQCVVVNLSNLSLDEMSRKIIPTMQKPCSCYKAKGRKTLTPALYKVFLRIAYYHTMIELDIVSTLGLENLLFRAACEFNINSCLRGALKLMHPNGSVFTPETYAYYIMLFPTSDVIFQLEIDWKRLKTKNILRPWGNYQRNGKKDNLIRHPTKIPPHICVKRVSMSNNSKTTELIKINTNVTFTTIDLFYKYYYEEMMRLVQLKSESAKFFYCNRYKNKRRISLP